MSSSCSPSPRHSSSPSRSRSPEASCSPSRSLSLRPEKRELRLVPATRRHRPFNDTKVEIYGLLNKVSQRALMRVRDYLRGCSPATDDEATDEVLYSRGSDHLVPWCPPEQDPCP